VIILTNTASQELAPGQSLIFNNVILHTGCSECFRNNSGSVTLGRKNAIYEISFDSNIGSTTAATPAQLDVMLNNTPLSETTMISTTAAVGDLNHVGAHTGVQTCCCGPEYITVTNTGDTTITVEDPSLFIKRVA